MKNSNIAGKGMLALVLTLALSSVSSHAAAEYETTRRMSLEVNVHEGDFGNRVCREIIRRDLVDEGIRIVDKRDADVAMKVYGTLVVQENVSDENMTTVVRTAKITDLNEDGEFDIDDDWVEYGSEEVPIVRGDASMSYDYEIRGANKAKGHLIMQRSGVEDSSSGFVDICKDIADEISGNAADALEEGLY